MGKNLLFLPSNMATVQNLYCGEETSFNQEKIGDVQDENLPDQHTLFETTTKNLTDDQ